MTASAALRWPAAMRPATAAEYLDMSEGHFRTHVAPELVAVSLGGRAVGYLLPFLRTSYGKPFTSGGFYNWFRERCEAAGIRAGLSPHGLRKTAAVHEQRTRSR